MSILESFSLAVKNILSSKTRTLLTMLGIIIGVAAVIVIVGLGNGLEQYMTDSFSGLGTNTLTVSVSSRGSTRSLSVDEMYGIVDENSQYLDQCSPTVSMNGYVKIGSDTVSSTSVQGVSEDYVDISGASVSSGRNLQYSDMKLRAKVCVIGAYIDRAYFGGSAVGQTMRIYGTTFTIVGVLAQQDEDLEEGGSDDCIYLPYTTASRISGEVSSYVITMKDENYIDQSVAALENALYEVFSSDDYYTVTSMAEMVETMTSMINILVALGAKERYIMQQFVIEAASTSALGGVTGILLGDLLSVAASVVATRLMGENLSVSPTLAAVAAAFGISVGIGILFGYLPAKKAAVLNPIDALHYD